MSKSGFADDPTDTFLNVQRMSKDDLLGYARRLEWWIAERLAGRCGNRFAGHDEDCPLRNGASVDCVPVRGACAGVNTVLDAPDPDGWMIDDLHPGCYVAMKVRDGSKWCDRCEAAVVFLSGRWSSVASETPQFDCIHFPECETQRRMRRRADRR